MTASKKSSEVVTASALSAHVDCSREAIRRLVVQGVLEQQPNGRFDLDDSRLRYIRHLRERRPPGEFRNRLEKAKAEREELRNQREIHQLVKLSDFMEGIDAMAFVVLKHLSPLPSRIGGRDLAARKRVDAELRIAQAGMSQELGDMGRRMGETGKAT
jgi:hypothetical protein